MGNLVYVHSILQHSLGYICDSFRTTLCTTLCTTFRDSFGKTFRDALGTTVFHANRNTFRQ
ncbi:MAG: hypothetical protein K2J86_06970, partial [Prevotella sp.]|nr:hypothetical protein [Prevotella sp.]